MAAVCLSNLEKGTLGALGGLSAVLVKFLGQDYGTVVAHAANLTADQVLGYEVGYGLLTPILMFLGAFVALISEEHKRLKMVALAVAAPAMITTWSGGQGEPSPPLPPASSPHAALIASAYAQTPDGAKEKLPPAHPDEIKSKDLWQQIQQGVGVFFGRGKQPQKYWVVVGSFTDRRAAQDFADAVNDEDEGLDAHVGPRADGGSYYPVIVGGHVFLSEARELKRRALGTAAIKDAYISAGEQQRQ